MRNAAATACDTDADCDTRDPCLPEQCVEGRCVSGPALVCDDHDPCTEDRCEPEVGCQFFPLSFDLDGDGYRGPLPGKRPGEPGSCGDDCDDSSALAHPGGWEQCDGIDNDCNGVVDDGATYRATGEEPVRVSGSELVSATASSIVYDGRRYLVTYTGAESKWRAQLVGLGADGRVVLPAEPLTSVGSDSFAGPIRSVGSLLVTAWEDRRQGANNFEIFLNRLDPEGRKFGPDLRVSSGADFSLHPDLLWTGSELVVVWDDRRDRPGRIWGQRVTLTGELVGENVPLLPVEMSGESPVLVQGKQGLGVVYVHGQSPEQSIAWVPVSFDLVPTAYPISISPPGSVEPSAVLAQDRVVVAWSTVVGQERLPGNAIWAAVLSESAEVIVSPRPVTEAADFARTPGLLSLGDRVLLFWAADAGEGHYELYARLLDLQLVPLGPVERLTLGSRDCYAPVAAFGPGGEIGVVFDRESSRGLEVCFTRLACVAAGLAGAQ